MPPLDKPFRSPRRPDLRVWICAGLIGDDVEIDGTFGSKPLLYAGHIAPDRGLAPVENFIRERGFFHYAGSHTRALFRGAYVTRLREATRSGFACVTGAVTTAAINRLVGVLDLQAMVQHCLTSERTPAYNA